MTDIVILDLFSGIGGFSKGLSDAGFNIVKHMYSEVDKHAIANYKHNFKNSEYVGSVTSLDGRTITRPNIITFGSPCQDFSVAGKRAGMAGSRSSLIGEAIRLIAECRPDVFIWENVKGVFSSNSGADFWGVVQAFANIGGYRLEWQLLNTAWVLPQNRERVYLVGHLAVPGRDFRGVFPFTDSNKLFTEGIREKGTGSSQLCGTITSNLKRGVHAGGETYIVASRGRGEDNEQQLEQRNDGVTNALTGVQKDNMILTHYGHENKDATEHDIVPTLKAESHGHEPMVVQKPLRWQRSEKGKENRKKNQKEGRDYTPFSEGNRELNPTDDGNSGCLTGAYNKDALIGVGTLRTHKDGQGFRETQSGLAPTIPARAREDGSGQPIVFVGGINPHNRGDGSLSRDYSEQDRVYDAELSKEAATVAATSNSKYLHNSQIRRLTEVECERLQGFPDGWTEFGIYQKQVWINKKEKTFKIVEGVYKIPKTQRYKLLGNAVTVAVVQMIGVRLLDEFARIQKKE